MPDSSPDIDARSDPSPETGDPVRIGYFGGTFDPPHRGHLAVARAARDRFHLDRVLLAPTGRQPFKPQGPEASWADRLRMTELLCAGEPGLEASAIDAPRPNGEPNYTVDTPRRLHASLAGQGSERPAKTPRIFGILGADAFTAFRQWREPDSLLRLAEWIAVSRPGVALPPADALGLATREGNTPLYRLTDVADPVSATDLRQRLRRGEPCTDLLPAAVLDYICQKGLYSTPAREATPPDAC